MEIAALPSCEKSLFAGAKVAFFFTKDSPRQSVTGLSGCNHFDKHGIYRVYTWLSLEGHSVCPKEGISGAIR